MPFEKILISKLEGEEKRLLEVGPYSLGYFIAQNAHGKENEDALFLSQQDSQLRFGVSDGAGGHPRGADAALGVVEEIQEIDSHCLLSKIQRANQKVLDLKVGAKSTLAFASIANGEVSFHHIGDSEIVYWNMQGRELYSSIPHSPAGLKVEAGVSSQEESLLDPERHIVISLMGDEQVQILSTTPFELKKGHTLLVGTDGLFDNLTHEQIGGAIQGGSFEEAFINLTKLCENRHTEDWLKDDDIAFWLFRKTRT